MRTEVHRQGMDVVRTVAMGLTLDSQMSRVSPDTLLGLAADIDITAAEALFISCTALTTSPVIEALETRIGKPVITSNQALAWHALRLAGDERPQCGLGRLFTLGR